MAALTDLIVMILVDCSEQNATNKALRKRFKVGGYPTVVFTDPEGKMVDELGARDPDSVFEKFNEVIGTHRW